MGISLRRLGKSLRDGTAVRRFWAALTVENSFPAAAFNGQQYALPAYGPDLCSATTTTTVTTVAGKLYELSATGSGTITIAVGTAASGTNILAAATYATARYFTAVGTTTHLTVTVTTGSLTDILVREVMLGELGSNLGASGYTMSVAGGTSTAVESPTGTLTLTGDGTNLAIADKQFTGLTVGAHYRIVYLLATNIANVRVGTTQGDSNTIPSTNPAATGVVTLEFTATATTHWIRFQRSGVGAAVISSITIAQWTPRPTLRTATFSEVFAFTGSSTTAKTRTNEASLIAADTAADAPRWDFSNGKARLLLENASTNLCLWSRDLTNAAWTKSNMTTAQTATGSDGVANSATTLTATAGNATALQAITSASSARITGCRIRRRTGSGNIQLTQDNGSTWTTVTVTSDWTRVSIASVTSTNPTVGIRIVTSGDAVDVDYFQHEAQAFLSSDTPTTSATVTRTIETARFSPLVEAIASLPGATLRVQATTLSAKVNQRIIGATSTLPILRADATTASTIGTGTGSLTATSILPGPFGAAVALNSSGQSLSANAGSATTSTTAANVRTQLYLARGGTVDASNPYGDGYYNGFALYPFRVSGTNLPTVSVAPT